MRRPLEISIIKPAWKISPDRAVPPGVGFTVVTRPFCVSGVSEMSNTICFMHFSYLLPSARNRRLSVRRAARHERHIKCCYFEPKRLLFHTTLRAFNCPRLLLLPPSRLPPPTRTPPGPGRPPKAADSDVGPTPKAKRYDWKPQYAFISCCSISGQRGLGLPRRHWNAGLVSETPLTAGGPGRRGGGRYGRPSGVRWIYRRTNFTHSAEGRRGWGG